MATTRDWVAGARPRTLPAALAPVFIGTGAAYAIDGGRVVPALLALVVALALQVGVNYANDYSDGVRGTDERRVGPIRLVSQGLAAPGTVKRAAFAAFGVAALAGLGLVAISGVWWLILVGAAAVLAAWFYTGGARPYGYLGLGEVFVFVFFGLVATVGTTFTQALTVSPAAWAGAVGVGALSCAILMANNIRDIPGDEQVGKRTLAVRLGDQRARWAYVALVAVAFMAALVASRHHPGALLALVAAVFLDRPARALRSGASGADLIPVLVATGRGTLAYGLGMGLGMLFWR